VSLLDGRKIDGRPLRQWLDVFRKLLTQYDIASLVPAVGVLPDRISGYGYAASTDSKEKYILYFVDERLFHVEPCKSRSLSVTLKLPRGRYGVQAFDPKNSRTIKLPEIQTNGSAKLKVPAFREDLAVLVQRRRD